MPSLDTALNLSFPSLKAAESIALGALVLPCMRFVTYPAEIVRMPCILRRYSALGRAQWAGALDPLALAAAALLNAEKRAIVSDLNTAIHHGDTLAISYNITASIADTARS